MYVYIYIYMYEGQQIARQKSTPRKFSWIVSGMNHMGCQRHVPR